MNNPEPILEQWQRAVELFPVWLSDIIAYGRKNFGEDIAALDAPEFEQLQLNLRPRRRSHGRTTLI